MNTCFLLSGGMGRVITAVPALEKYQRLNPKDDFVVLVNMWDQVFWNHPMLQDRVFPADQLGNFQQHIRSRQIREPEPYWHHDFYNQKLGLVDTFDIVINATNNHEDLRRAHFLYISDRERALAENFVRELKSRTQKQHCVIFQPFGSAAELIGDHIVDPTHRSLSREAYMYLGQLLSQHAAVIYAGSPQLKHPMDCWTHAFDELQPWPRFLMALTSVCDYFVGVCSVGQHVARAFGTPGTVIMGPTSDTNFGYRDHFQILRPQKEQPQYLPWRLGQQDWDHAVRHNHNSMFMDQKICSDIGDAMIKDFLDRVNDTHTSVALPHCVAAANTVLQTPNPMGSLGSYD